MALRTVADRMHAGLTNNRSAKSSVRRAHVANAQPQVVHRAASRYVSAQVRVRSSRQSISVKAEFAPPTVAETKRKFIEAYNRPIPAVYNTVVQELLVQQHFIRYNINYQYNPVYALGFVSVFDQILDGFESSDKEDIFTSYIESLGEKPAQYRADAELLESQARSLSGPDGLVPDASGSELQQALAAVAAATEAGKFSYNRFFAVGLFRLLELTGAKEPAALEKLVNAVGVKPSAVNKDLLMYKGVLSKLSAAKEMMREFIDREKRKQAEREAAKAQKTEAANAEQPAQA